MKYKSILVLVALAAVAFCSRRVSLAGDWDATIVDLAKAEVPFRFVIGGTTDAPTGTFVNGEERMPSTGGHFEDGQLTINFDQYGSKIIARLNGDMLEGEYNRGTRGPAYPFTATRAIARPKDPHPPSIAGEWKIPTPEEKYEHAWTFIVRQSGGDVSAAIQRVDGDTGTLVGSFRDGRLVLGHFSGARPLRLEVTPNPDGTLALIEDGQVHRTAIRASDQRAAAVDARDPAALTRVKDAAAPLAIAFPDLDGHLVSLSDRRFAGKVVILSITGSWCPNCHDEAPFLTELYRRYHDRGLEVVMLAFEEARQLQNPQRLRAFVKQYGITFPVLVAGEPEALPAKLPQFEDLVAFPTSIYIGRDGRVKATHAGFSSKATGELYTRTTGETIELVERLLSEHTLPGHLLASGGGALSGGTRPSQRRVSVVASVRKRSASAYDLVLKVAPYEGMHVYAPGAHGYRPVTLDVERSPGVTPGAAKFPASEDYYFAPLKEHVPVYEKPFEIVTPVTVKGDASSVLATLAYQACDDHLCYLPESIPVQFTIK
ncbi:MAG TPA: TlpA disulfide reductase family protein [Vicinamibacterales bacterium]|nr:TlpA disulfide reductase family protein [Vicinamibacterales bacterium]